MHDTANSSIPPETSDLAVATNKPERWELVKQRFLAKPGLAIQRIAPNVLEAIARDMWEGRSLKSIASDHGLENQKLYRLARQVGWQVSWRSFRRPRIASTRVKNPKPATFEAIEFLLNGESISARFKVSAVVIKAMALNLWEGKSIESISTEYKVPRTIVTAVAHHIGWNLSWRGKIIAPSPKVGTMLVKDVVQLLAAGKTLVAIGAMAKVSRERIRQIGVREGCKPRWEYIREKKEIERPQREAELAIAKAGIHTRRAARKSATLQRFVSQVSEANELWKKGLSIKDVSAATGIKESDLPWHMLRARKQLGSDWFPLRAKKSRSKRYQVVYDRIVQAADEVVRLWDSNLTNQQIAAKLGFTSVDQLIDGVRRLRQLPPRRKGAQSNPEKKAARAAERAKRREAYEEKLKSARQRFIDKMSPINELWNQGNKMKEIGDKLGYTTAKLNSFIQRSRQILGPEWFVLRNHPASKVKSRVVLRDKHKQRDEAHRQQLMEKCQVAQDLWKKGHTRVEIAEAAGWKLHSLDANISRARKKLGAKWFPLRNKTRRKK